MGPLSQSLPQLVHNSKEIFAALLAPLVRSGTEGSGSGKSDEDASAVLSADALAALHVALARDLQNDWLSGTFLEELAAAWGLWLKERKRSPRGASSSSSSDLQQLGGNGGKDARVLAAAFGCMGGVFRHLGRTLSSVSASSASASSASASAAVENDDDGTAPKTSSPPSSGLARALAATRAMRLDAGAPASRLGSQAGGYLVRRASAFRGPEAAARAVAAVVADAAGAIRDGEKDSDSPSSSRSVAAVAAAAGAVVGEACLGPKGALHSRVGDVLGALLSLASSRDSTRNSSSRAGKSAPSSSSTFREIAALASLEAARRVSAHVKRGKSGALWQALLSNAERALREEEEERGEVESTSSSSAFSSSLSHALDLVSVAVECARGAKVEDYAPLVSLAARASELVVKKKEKEKESEAEAEETSQPSSLASLSLSTSRLMAAVSDGHRRAVGASGGPLALASKALPQWRAFFERGPIAAAAAASRAARAALSTSPNAARAAAPALLAPLARAVALGEDGEKSEARLGALAELAGAASDLGGTRRTSSPSSSLSGWPASPMLPLASCGLGPKLAGAVLRVAAGEEWEGSSSSRPRRPSRLAVAAAVAAAAALPHAARSPREAAAAARSLLERATAASERSLENEGEATAAELAAAEGAALRVLARALAASATTTTSASSSSSSAASPTDLSSLAPRCVALLLAHPTTPSAVAAAADVLEMAAAAAAAAAAGAAGPRSKSGSSKTSDLDLIASAEQKDALLSALSPSLSSPSARLRSGALRALVAARPEDVGAGPLSALAGVLAGDLDVARGRAGAVAVARVGEGFARGLFSAASSASLSALATHALVGSLSVRFAPLWPAARTALAEALRADFAVAWPVVLSATAEAQRAALAGEGENKVFRGGKKAPKKPSAEEEEASRVRISFGDGEDAAAAPAAAGGDSDSDSDDDDDGEDSDDDDDDDGNRADAEGGPAFAVSASDATLGGPIRLLAFLSATAVSSNGSADAEGEGEETNLTSSGAVGASTRLGHLLQALSESGGGATSRSLSDWAPLYLAFAAARPGAAAAAPEAEAEAAVAVAAVAEESDEEEDDEESDRDDEEKPSSPLAPLAPQQQQHFNSNRRRSSSGFRPLGARAWRDLLLHWLAVLKAAGGAVRSCQSPGEKKKGTSSASASASAADEEQKASPPSSSSSSLTLRLASSLGSAIGDVDGRVQSSALEVASKCLNLPWLSPALLARLRRLADDATLRRELVAFPLALPDSISSVPSSSSASSAPSPSPVIPLGDRDHVLPLVARLLWPKMRRRSGRLGGRGAPGSARAACLNFLASAAPGEAGHAVSLFVAPLAPFLLVEPDAKGSSASSPVPISGGLFEQPWWSRELVHGERGAGWWLEAASGLRRSSPPLSSKSSNSSSNSFSTSNSLRARLGFANAASDLLERAGHRLGPCLPAVVALTVAVYESVAIPGGGGGEGGEGEEEEGRKGGDEEGKNISPLDAAAARETRAASLRALSSALERFPDACDWSPLWPRLLPGLARAAERVAADSAAAGRAPALLEFVAAVAASPALAPLLADALAAFDDDDEEEAMETDAPSTPPCPARGSAAASAGNAWAASGLGSKLAASLADALASPVAAPPARDAALRSLESLAGLGESYVREILGPHSGKLLLALQGLAGAGEVVASAASASTPSVPPAGAKTRLRALGVLQSLAGASPPGSEAGAPLARALLPLLAPPKKKRKGGRGRASPAAEVAAAALAAVLVRAAEGSSTAATPPRRLPMRDVAAIASALSLPLAACPAPPAGDPTRSALLSCWEALAEGHAPPLLPVCRLLRDLDAASVTEVGSPDYDRRLDAYAKLREPGDWRVVATAAAGAAGEEVEDESSSSVVAAAAVAALARRALSDLSDRGDLALRHAAAGAVTALVIASAQAKKKQKQQKKSCSEADAALTSAADRVVFAAARARAAAPDAAVAQEHLLLLRALAVNDPENYPGLALLADANDEEVDFFCNAAHLQLHRRARALGKLTKVFTAEAAALAASASSSSASSPPPSFPAGTALGVVLPIIESAMLSVGGTKALASLSIDGGGGAGDGGGTLGGVGGHGVSSAAASRGAAVADAAVGALSALASAMPWRHYAQVLGRSLRLLSRHPESKAAVRGVCAVVDAFHFGDRILAAASASASAAAATAAAAASSSAEQLAAAADAADAAAAAADSRAEAEAAEAAEAARASYADDAGITANKEGEGEGEEAEVEGESDDDDDDAADDEVPGETENIVDEEAADIARSLTDRALPSLQRVLVCDGSVRPAVGIAIAKLVKVLPASDVAAALPRALQSVAGLLRSRSQACRDDARRAFVQMVAALGPPYLPFALSVLASALPPRGIFGHVAAYTAHACLAALAEAARKRGKEADASADDDDDDNAGRRKSTFSPSSNNSGLLDPGAFDTSLTRALEIVEGDLFGEAASERASATAAASGGGALHGGSAGGGGGGGSTGFGGGAKEVRASTGVASFELLAAGITWNRHAGTLLQSPVRDRLREAASSGLAAPQRRAALSTAASLLSAAVRGLSQNASATAEDRLTWAYALIKEGVEADESSRRAIHNGGGGQQPSAAASVEANRRRARKGEGRDEEQTFVDGDVIVRPARLSGTERTAVVKAAAEAAATASGAGVTGVLAAVADSGAALLFAEAGLSCVCRELKLSPAPDAKLVDALLPLLVKAMRCRNDAVARGALKAVAAATVRYARRRNLERKEGGGEGEGGEESDDDLDDASLPPLLPGLAAAAPAAASNAAALLRRAPEATSPAACAALGFLATLWRLPGGGAAISKAHALPPPNPEAVRAVLRVAFSLSGSSSTAKAPPLPSTQALEVFRALAGRRVLVPEMYDAADAAQRAAVTADDAAARSRASRALLAFLLDLPLGPRRLASHLERAAANLEYEHADGREGAADLLRAIAGAFPREALGEWAPAVAVPLSARLVSEPEAGPRAAARKALSVLFARVPEETADKLAGFSAAWLDGGGGGGSKNKKKSRGKGGGARARAGALALELQVRTEAAAALKASRVSAANSAALAAAARRHAALALPAAVARLESIAGEDEEEREKRREEEEEREEREAEAAARAAAEEEDEGEGKETPAPSSLLAAPAPLPTAPARWAEVYACLCLLEACADVSAPSSSASLNGNNSGGEAGTALPLPLPALAAAARLSLFPHAWVRRSASRLVGRALAAELSASASSASASSKKKPSSFVAAAGGARALARRALSAAQHPSAWEDPGLLAQACKNVVALAPALYELDEAEGLLPAVAEKEKEKNDEEEEEEDASASDDDDEIEKQKSSSSGLTLLALCRVIARMAQDRRHGSEPQAAAALRLSAALASRLGPSKCSGPLLTELCVPLFRLTEGGAPCSPEIKALAAQVVDALRTSSSSSEVFLEAYAAARAGVLRRRGLRRREAALRAVADPAAAARAKIAKQARRASGRKKKMAEVARLRAAGIRVKNQRGGSSNSRRGGRSGGGRGGLREEF